MRRISDKIHISRRKKLVMFSGNYRAHQMCNLGAAWRRDGVIILPCSSRVDHTTNLYYPLVYFFFANNQQFGRKINYVLMYNVMLYIRKQEENFHRPLFRWRNGIRGGVRCTSTKPKECHACITILSWFTEKVRLVPTIYISFKPYAHVL